VAEHLAEDFVDLRREGLGLNRRAKLPLEGREGALDAAALRVGGEELFLLQHEGGMHLAPRGRAVRLAVDLEGHEGRGARGFDGGQVLVGQVGLVGRNLIHGEALLGGLDQLGKLRAVRAIAGRDLDRGDDLGRGPDHGVRLEPRGALHGLAVLFVNPADVAAGPEACGVDGEAALDAGQWGSAALNQADQDGGHLGLGECRQRAVVVRGAGHVAGLGRSFDIASRAAGGHEAVSLHRHGEDHVRKRDGLRATASVGRRLHALAEPAQQRLHGFLLGGLASVVGGPVLRVCGAVVGQGFGQGGVAGRVGLDGLGEAHCPLMLAAAAAKLVVRAGAGLLGDVHEVAARGLCLRWDQPGHASDVADSLVLGEKASALLPKVRVRCVHELQCSHNVAHSQEQSDLVLWPQRCYVVRMAKTAKKPKAQAAPNGTKDDVVRMRVSAEHKAAFVAAAGREGLELSQWLRRLALRAAGLLPDAQGK
jgi:hypothetical protein